MVVGQALTAVGALETGTVQDILADFDLAVSLRLLHEQTSPGTRPPDRRTRNRHAHPGTAAHPGASHSPGDYARRGGGPLAAQIQVGRSGPPTRAARLAGSWPAGSSRITGTGGPGAARSRPGSRGRPTGSSRSG